MTASNAADSSPCLTAGRMANIPLMRMGCSLWMRLLEQLDALDALLGGGTAPAFVLLHSPLRDRRGGPYGPFTRSLENALELEASSPGTPA